MGFEEIQNIARSAAARYGDNIEKAVREAEAAVRRHPQFKEFQDRLIKDALREMIYDCRHQTNRQIRQDAGVYGGVPKVNLGHSKEMSKVHQSSYDYRINGSLLVLMTGKDLQEIASSERQVANGHMFNVSLCDSLARIVPQDQTVKQVVPEKKLQGIFERVRKQMNLSKVG